MFFFSTRLSRLCVHDCGVNELAQVDPDIYFFFQFHHSTLSCFKVELHSLIQFAFICD